MNARTLDLYSKCTWASPSSTAGNERVQRREDRKDRAVQGAVVERTGQLRRLAVGSEPLRDEEKTILAAEARSSLRQHLGVVGVCQTDRRDQEGGESEKNERHGHDEAPIGSAGLLGLLCLATETYSM